MNVMVSWCLLVGASTLTVSASANAETALQMAYLADSAAHGAATYCSIERARPSACLSAEALKKAATAHYRAMMPADMDGALYRWEAASKRCEERCDDAGFALISDAKDKYEALELQYLSINLTCKSKLESALCVRVLDLQAQKAGK